MYAYVTREDIDLWRALGREDLIADYESDSNMWAGDTIVSNNGISLSPCRFLLYTNDVYSCSIYEARPAVCRNFMPGVSRFCAIHVLNIEEKRNNNVQ
jgi:Fe-S-cluster containining protein